MFGAVLLPPVANVMLVQQPKVHKEEAEINLYLYIYYISLFMNLYRNILMSSHNNDLIQLGLVSVCRTHTLLCAGVWSLPLTLALISSIIKASP